MKRISTFVAVFALSLTLATGALAGNTDREPTEAEALAALKQAETEAVTAARWEAFSDNLVHALQSDIEGVKLSAMQMVIRYEGQVDVDAAVFDIVRLYRDHRDDDVRRMAVVALGKMQHPWAMDLLKRSLRFEKDAAVRHTLLAVVSEYYGGRVQG